MRSLCRAFLSRHSRMVSRPAAWSQLLKRTNPETTGDEKEREGNSGYYRPCVIITFPITADREETPVLIIIIRIKAFTVFGLMSIRFAISLLLRPCTKYANASPSRCVRLNCSEICDKGISPDGPRSSSTAMLG